MSRKTKSMDALATAEVNLYHHGSRQTLREVIENLISDMKKHAGWECGKEEPE